MFMVVILSVVVVIVVNVTWCTGDVNVIVNADANEAAAMFIVAVVCVVGTDAVIVWYSGQIIIIIVIVSVVIIAAVHVLRYLLLLLFPVVSMQYKGHSNTIKQMCVERILSCYTTIGKTVHHYMRCHAPSRVTYR